MPPIAQIDLAKLDALIDKLDDRLERVETQLHMRAPDYVRADLRRLEEQAALERPLLELWQSANCLPGVTTFPGNSAIMSWAAGEIARLRSEPAQQNQDPISASAYSASSATLR